MNPVGIDATVKDHGTRCTAAGYIWNPYYTQLADPLNVKLIYLKIFKNLYSLLFLTYLKLMFLSI